MSMSYKSKDFKYIKSKYKFTSRLENLTHKGLIE